MILSVFSQEFIRAVKIFKLTFIHIYVDVTLTSEIVLKSSLTIYKQIVVGQLKYFTVLTASKGTTTRE